MALAAHLLCSPASFVTPPSRQSSESDAGSISSARVGRRNGLAAGLLSLTLTPGENDRALAAKKKLKLGEDDYGEDFSNLDGKLKKDWNQAVEETRCKTWDEGERRSFCVTQEINRANCERAKERGEKCKDEKATLSKGSYGT